MRILRDKSGFISCEKLFMSYMFCDRKKFLCALIFLTVFLISTPVYSATRRNTNTNNQNQAQSQAQSGAGTAMSPEEEQALMEAARTMKRSGLVQFNFKDMDLVRFMRFMSELLDENIIVPPNINSKITIISPHPVTVKEAREIMLSTLQMYNFSLQDMGSYSVVRQGGNSPSPHVYRSRSGPSFGEETVTYIVPIDYITVESVIPALQQAFGNAIMVLPVGNNRDVLLQGRATDVRKAMDLIRKLDTPQSAKLTRIFDIKNADPTVVANQLNAIAQTGGSLQGTTAIADAPSKKVIVVGSSTAIDKAAAIIKDLDVDNKAGDFHIYRLKYIDATAAAEQLGKVLAASPTLQPGQDGGKINPVVVPDVATNSLIFAATQTQYDSILKILDVIDVQPRQVLLRGFIAEVNITNLERNGIDWSIMGGQIWDNFMLGGNASLGEGSIPSDFMTWFDNLSKQEELVDRNGSTYSVTNYQPLAMMYATIEMLKRYDAVNILSVPRLMCTDNKESTFQVGDVIPVLKGSASDLANPGAIQNNYDYKETGLTLTVTPHIRTGDVVALDIKQTTEDVLSPMGSATPTTTKREVNTSVLVSNGETIILGGMIEETESSVARRVPGFSYIPLIGGLFKKVAKQVQKVDIVIFLTPQIISSPEEMRHVVVNESGLNKMISQDLSGFDPSLLPAGARKQINDINISPMEAEVDRRFRDMYKESLKRRK